MRNYYQLPDLPNAGLLTRYMDTLGVIVPVARTNIMTNPSLETGATNYGLIGTAAGDRTTERSYHGAYSFYVDPGAGLTSGMDCSTPTLAAGTTYAFSAKAWGAKGVPYKLSLASTSGPTDLAVTRFIGAGVWQWIWGFWVETSSTGRLLMVTKDNSASTRRFYVDGLQLEACGSEGVFVTTYIDGDQTGLVPNQFPPAYGWNGTPHASASYRIGQTRAGGRVVKFKDFGFLLTAIIGLGLALPAHRALTFAQLDGGQYGNTLKPPRQFSLAGRWCTQSPTQLDAGMAQLGRLLDRDLVAQRQPLVLAMQAEDCGVPIGEPVQIQALYSGGMEGGVQELPSAAQGITFTNYLPMILSSDQGAALAVQQNVSNANNILQRSATGVWGAVGTGTNNQVLAMARGTDGSIYVAGTFTTAGGASAQYIAKWNGSAWSTIGSATTFGSTIYALAIGPDGTLYAGGAFINAGGIANADYIAKWNGSAWSALGTGANNNVRALIVGPDGTLYAGGDFTSMSGVANTAYIAKWNGSAWSALGTGMNAVVNALAVGIGGEIYAGGGFTTAGGGAANDVAKWNGSAWSALGSGITGGSVYTLVVGPDGHLYAGGLYTTAGGVSAGNIAVWNGTSWYPLGAGTLDSIFGLAFDASGILYAVGEFTVAGGITLPDPLARWNGATWLPGDVDLPSLPFVWCVLPAPDGSLYLGFGSSGTAIAAGITTATNNGTAEVYPTLTINGPSSGTSRIYQIVNTTTGAAIYFNLILNAGETAVLNLDPTNVTFTSNFRGNIISTILPGSQTTAFVLQPGSNSISFFAASSTVTAVLQWQVGYVSLNDALQVAVP